MPIRCTGTRSSPRNSKFGDIIAPQSIAVALDFGHGVQPACVGRIPGSHLIFGGEEWWFYGAHDPAGRPAVPGAPLPRLQGDRHQVRRPDDVLARRHDPPQPARHAGRQGALDRDPLSGGRGREARHVRELSWAKRSAGPRRSSTEIDKIRHDVDPVEPRRHVAALRRR